MHLCILKNFKGSGVRVISWSVCDVCVIVTVHCTVHSAGNVCVILTVHTVLKLGIQNLFDAAATKHVHNKSTPVSCVKNSSGKNNNQHLSPFYNT